MFKNIVFDFYGVIFDSKTGTLNNDILTVVSSLKKDGYKLHIFTNTDLDHLHRIDEVNPFINFFDNSVSCVDFPKPNEKAFECLLQLLGCDPTEIVMIDDKERNIAAAKTFGIMGIVFTNNEELRIKLSNLLNDN